MITKDELKEGILSGLKKGYDLSAILDAFDVVNDTLAMKALIELVDEERIRFEVN